MGYSGCRPTPGSRRAPRPEARTQGNTFPASVKAPPLDSHRDRAERGRREELLCRAGARELGRRLATDHFQLRTQNTRDLPDHHTARHGSLRGVLSALLAPLEAPRLPSAVGEWGSFLAP